VDGHEVSLLRADFAFRAVALGPGSHKIKFLYRPFTVILGLVLSSLALLGAVALVSLGGEGCALRSRIVEGLKLGAGRNSGQF
jgi:hypothetical protein